MLRKLKHILLTFCFPKQAHCSVAYNLQMMFSEFDANPKRQMLAECALEQFVQKCPMNSFWACIFLFYTVGVQMSTEI